MRTLKGQDCVRWSDSHHSSIILTDPVEKTRFLEMQVTDKFTARKNETADDVDDDESPSKKIKAELDDDEEEKADAAGEGSDDGSA